MSKRPVAFRVPRLLGDMVSHYFVTTSEDEARAMADTNQVDYEGLYLVSDRRPTREELAQIVCDALWGQRDIAHRNDEVREAGFRVADAVLGHTPDVAQSVGMRKALEDCLGCLVGAEAEGLHQTINSLRDSEHFDTADVFRLIDLVERRLMWVREYAVPALAAQPPAAPVETRGIPPLSSAERNGPDETTDVLAAAVRQEEPTTHSGLLAQGMEGPHSSAATEREDNTCYVNRSEVRCILLAQSTRDVPATEKMLRAIDALQIFVAADFRTEPQTAPKPITSASDGASAFD